MTYFKTGNDKAWTSVTEAKDPKYQNGEKVVSVKTNPDTPKSDHKTWISDGKGNLDQVTPKFK